VMAGRGMKINHIFYWSEHFRNPAWESAQVPVRYDPFDIGTAFAFVDHQWVECHSEHYASLHGHSEREVHLAGEELRKRRQNHSGQFAVTASALADFLKSVEQEEAILIQRLGDLEARSLQTQPEMIVTGPALQDAPELFEPALLPPPPSFVTYGEM
jgi:putative transposase